METIIPDESFGVFYRREYSVPLQTGVPSIDGPVGLSSGQLVEIIGPHQSGKTKLLIQIAVRCILPMSCGGRESVALMIDLDHRMDVQVLISHLQKHIQDDSILEDCLQRFQLISCDSTFEFLATLQVLPAILSTERDSLSPLGCILIDNWNAFYAMLRAKPSSEQVPMTLESARDSAFRLIDRLRSFHVPIIVTKDNKIQVEIVPDKRNQAEGEARDKERWQQTGLNQNQIQGPFSQRFFLIHLQQITAQIKNRWGLSSGLLDKHTIVIKPILPEGPAMKLDFEV